MNYEHLGILFFPIPNKETVKQQWLSILSVKRRIQGNGMAPFFFLEKKKTVIVKGILHILYVKLKTEIHCCHMTSQFSFAWNVIRKGDPSYGIWIISLGALQT